MSDLKAEKNAKLINPIVQDAIAKLEERAHADPKEILKLLNDEATVRQTEVNHKQNQFEDIRLLWLISIVRFGFVPCLYPLNGSMVVINDFKEEATSLKNFFDEVGFVTDNFDQSYLSIDDRAKIASMNEQELASCKKYWGFMVKPRNFMLN